MFYLYKIAKSFYNCYTLIKNKFTIVLLLILALAVYNSNAQRLHDSYFWEPLPLTAPEWMKQIEKDPSGVNSHEMQRLFNEWKAVDVDMMICGRLAVTEAPGGEDYVYALVTCDSWGYDAGPIGRKGAPYILVSKDCGESWENQTDKGGKAWDITFSPIMNASGGQGFFDIKIVFLPASNERFT